MKFSNGISPLTLEISRLIVKSLGCAETAHGRLLLSGDFRGYVSQSVTPPDCRNEYLVSELLSKFPFEIGIDRKQVAIDKFLAVESSIKSHDVNLRRLLRGAEKHPDFHWVFNSMQRKIARCLGTFCWSRAERWFGFGPGANVGVKRRVSQGPNKYGLPRPSVTSLCLDAGVAAICSHSVWRDFHTSISGQRPDDWFTVVPGNKVVTVPKNSKTDRVIAIEPLINMYIQKGIGGAIRSSLRYVGIDLNDQSSNQRLARQASLDGELATIDLSSASDSISWFLVQELLPPDWVAAIEICRSPTGVLPNGDTILYRKVSSMGNGYTFELESLIFWALCQSVIEYSGTSDQRCGIYGDDLIVSCSVAPLVIEILRLIGFETNSKKTFLDGPFRESCGYHGSSGVDFSPFYIRENIDSPDRLILLANSIRQWALNWTSSGWSCDGRLDSVWDKVVSLVPPDRRVFGPLFIEDQLNAFSIGVNFDECCPAVCRAPHFVEGFIYRRLARRVKTRRFDHVGSLIGNLDMRRDLPGRAISSTGVEGGWRVKTSVVRSWRDPGPWLTSQGM